MPLALTVLVLISPQSWFSRCPVFLEKTEGTRYYSIPVANHLSAASTSGRSLEQKKFLFINVRNRLTITQSGTRF